MKLDNSSFYFSRYHLLSFILRYCFVSFDSSDVAKRVLSAGALYMNNKIIAVASAIRKKHFDED